MFTHRRARSVSPPSPLPFAVDLDGPKCNMFDPYWWSLGAVDVSMSEDKENTVSLARSMKEFIAHTANATVNPNKPVCTVEQVAHTAHDDLPMVALVALADALKEAVKKTTEDSAATTCATLRRRRRCDAFLSKYQVARFGRDHGRVPLAQLAQGILKKKMSTLKKKTKKTELEELAADRVAETVEHRDAEAHAIHKDGLAKLKDASRAAKVAIAKSANATGEMKAACRFAASMQKQVMAHS